MTPARPKDRYKVRLMALQIAAQLPANPHEALRYLDVARQIVVDGMDDTPDDGNVVRIVPPDGAAQGRLLARRLPGCWIGRLYPYLSNR